MVTLLTSSVSWCLPRPPEGAVDSSLIFGHGSLDCVAQTRDMSLSQVVRGVLQFVDVVQQSSLRQSVRLLFGQNMCHLLDTSGVALIYSC